jgi:hypothetical protein
MLEIRHKQVDVIQFGNSSLLRSSVLHKNQSTTIALVHGLFTHEGYWLPYLKLLRGFRLIMVGVAYEHRQFDPKFVSSSLEDVCRKESVDVLVGHSLGASLVRATESKVRKVLICDVGRARRLQVPPFEKIIPALEKVSEAERARSFKNAQELYTATSGILEGNELVFTPTNDEYFAYSDKPNFVGTHFDIENAVSYLARSLHDVALERNST